MPTRQTGIGSIRIVLIMVTRGTEVCVRDSFRHGPRSQKRGGNSSIEIEMSLARIACFIKFRNKLPNHFIGDFVTTRADMWANIAIYCIRSAPCCLLEFSQADAGYRGNGTTPSGVDDGK